MRSLVVGVGVADVGATSLATSTDVTEHVAVAIGFNSSMTRSTAHDYFTSTSPGGQGDEGGIGVIASVYVLRRNTPGFPCTSHVGIDG